MTDVIRNVGLKSTLAINKGSASIELALLLPLFIALCLGILEFGFYFVRDEIANNAVSNIITH